MLSLIRLWKWRISMWILKFAQKPYAKTTIFIHSFADSSFFPITIDLSLIPISIAAPKKSFIFGFWATIGSTLGGLLAYYIGMEFMSTIGKNIVSIFDNADAWDKMIATFRGDYAIWTLVVASLTPLPFALATMASGVVEMDLTTFILVSFTGRAVRFLILSLLIYYFGTAVQVFLDKYSRILAIFFFSFTFLFILYLIIF